MTQDFKKLAVWQKAHQLTLEIYKQSRKFPFDERFGLTQQIRRSVTSVVLNIAEGTSGSNKRLEKYLVIAQGSCKETECNLMICNGLNFIDNNICNQLTEKCRILQASIQNFINTVKKNGK
ncbi:MAG: four helix bundle protein [Candidatus Woesearchaeota archaeon]